jgi:hypothetical protein
VAPSPGNPIPKTKFRNSARVGVHVLAISIPIQDGSTDPRVLLRN